MDQKASAVIIFCFNCRTILGTYSSMLVRSPILYRNGSFDH